jgi:hypothetical protein
LTPFLIGIWKVVNAVSVSLTMTRVQPQPQPGS